VKKCENRSLFDKIITKNIGLICWTTPYCGLYLYIQTEESVENNFKRRLNVVIVIRSLTFSWQLSRPSSVCSEGLRWKMLRRSDCRSCDLSFARKKEQQRVALGPGNARFYRWHRYRRYIAIMSICWPISRPKLYAPGPCSQSCSLRRCCCMLLLLTFEA